MNEQRALRIVERLCGPDAPGEPDLPPEISRLIDSLTSAAHSRDELVARYLYLQCVQDQGGEITGVRLYVSRSILRMHEAGIEILANPLDFFRHIERSLQIIKTVHEETREERKHSIKAPWSLFDQTRPIPSIVFRWGSPLAILNSLQEKDLGLLGWIQSWRYAGDLVDKTPRLKMDKQFGLGKAIGDKASWLFLKLIIHKYRLISSNNDAWGPNSYQIPLDQNVGRVLMRSGVFFAYTDADEFDRKVCVKQPSGRKNLAANKVRNLKPQHKDDQAFKAGLQLRKKLQSSRVSVLSLPLVINGMLEVLRQRGVNASLGRLDDSLMHVGLTYCRNDPKDMDCEHCPLTDLCYAYNDDRKWIDDYYCGKGTGTFEGM